MISSEEVKKLAALARIEMSKKELEELQRDLGRILDYISQLQKASINVSEGAKALAPSTFNVFREDEPIEDTSDIKKGEHIKVKHIL